MRGCSIEDFDIEEVRKETKSKSKKDIA